MEDFLVITFYCPHLCNLFICIYYSGGSHGFIIGHVTPEAQVGGPIALVRDGDTIVIDAV